MTERAVTFEHEPKSYTVAQFFENFSGSLPIVAIVSQGYCGDIGLETFGMGQVIRVHTYSSQKRVVAKVLKGKTVQEGREISIPLNYDIKFCVKGGKKSDKELTLSEIIDKHTLPVEVTASDSSGVVSIQGQQRSVGELCIRLLSTYEDKYLLGNPVSDGMLYGRVTAVPLYLPDLRLSAVNGIKGYDGTQWKDCLGKMESQVKENVKFDTKFGNPHIAVYSQPDKSQVEDAVDFTYKAPAEYYNMDEILNVKNQNRPSTILVHDQSPNVYEVIPAYAEKKMPPKTAPKPRKNSQGVSSIDTTTKPPLPNRNSKEENESKGSSKPAPESASASSVDATPKETKTVILTDGKPPDRPKTFRRLPVEPSAPDDLPKYSKPEALDIHKMSIAELGYWMRQLKLDKYVAAFEENAVDGTLLLELNNEILKQEFNMSTFEALKLSKFANTGHVPK